jgi:hypothetical protein
MVGFVARWRWGRRPKGRRESERRGKDGRRGGAGVEERKTEKKRNSAEEVTGAHWQGRRGSTTTSGSCESRERRGPKKDCTDKRHHDWRLRPEASTPGIGGYFGLPRGASIFTSSFFMGGC